MPSLIMVKSVQILGLVFSFTLFVPSLLFFKKQTSTILANYFWFPFVLPFMYKWSFAFAIKQP